MYFSFSFFYKFTIKLAWKAYKICIGTHLKWINHNPMLGLDGRNRHLNATIPYRQYNISWAVISYWKSIYIQAYLSFIQHKSLQIVHIPVVTSFSCLDTWINFKDLELACFLKIIRENLTTKAIEGQVFHVGWMSKGIIASLFWFSLPHFQGFLLKNLGGSCRLNPLKYHTIPCT